MEEWQAGNNCAIYRTMLSWVLVWVKAECNRRVGDVVLWRQKNAVHFWGKQDSQNLHLLRIGVDNRRIGRGNICDWVKGTDMIYNPRTIRIIQCDKEVIVCASKYMTPF